MKGTTAHRNLLNDESGQDLFEYALVALMIALAAVTAVTGVGHLLVNQYNAIANGF